MEMNFERFCDNYFDLKVKQKRIGDFLEDTLPVVRDLSFAKEHKVFYPKGLFTDEELSLFFLTDTNVNRVSVYETGLEIQTWSLEEISSVKLVIPDRYDAGLEIHLRSGEQISFDNKKDTNNTWSTRFRDDIKFFYKSLTDN